MIQGIHHITLITSSAKKNVEFYTKILGLRLVKKTVNQDAPDTYHFYFGNTLGEPGTVLTFFPFKGISKGLVGTGQVSVTQFNVPKNSLKFWQDCFKQNSVDFKVTQSPTGLNSLDFTDFDGLKYSLVENNVEMENSYDQVISNENSIKGFYGAILDVENLELTQKVLVDILDYSTAGEKDNFVNYKIGDGLANSLTIHQGPNSPSGIQGFGTVHHIAFRVADYNEQMQIREKVLEHGLHATPVIDRYYFKSVYFRDENGILFEIA